MCPRPDATLPLCETPCTSECTHRPRPAPARNCVEGAHKRTHIPTQYDPLNHLRRRALQPLQARKYLLRWAQEHIGQLNLELCTAVYWQSKGVMFGRWLGAYRYKCNLLQGGRPCLSHSPVQWRKDGKHNGHIAITKIQAAGLLQSFMPLLMPQYGHTNELCADLQQPHTRIILSLHALWRMHR